MDDDWEYEDCPNCGHLAKYFECWNCGGDGGWHPHDDLPLEYDPDEFEVCDICKGTGSYWICPYCSKEAIES